MKRMAIIGGGASALFLLRSLIEKRVPGLKVDIFERNAILGAGLAYGPAGAGEEHVTNVSGNEIPDLVTPLVEWLRHPSKKTVLRYQQQGHPFSDYNVVPRLLFGEYLNEQFDHYLDMADLMDFSVSVHLKNGVTALKENQESNRITVCHQQGEDQFDIAVVCCGHCWPQVEEGLVKDHFDSPYPPAKLRSLQNRVVELRGCSLTAVDAIRTLARANGSFSRNGEGRLRFDLRPGYDDFRIRMRSRHAILPGMRFHLEDPHLSRRSLLSTQAIQVHREENAGFVSLDFIFRYNFKEQFRETDLLFYEQIKDMTLEEFVAAAMSSFSAADPFDLFAAEYEASLASIRDGKSEYWKEKLAILSVAMNYPAKYFSAEDMKRLRGELMPLISIVIAFIPQNSAEELLALHDSGRLTLSKSDPEKEFPAGVAFIDCTGQPHLSAKDFPFQDLVRSGTVSQARVRYQNEGGEMDVPGLAIDDHFRAVNKEGKTALPLFIMAVPYIGGFNPDYSGLDFCEDAAKAIVEDLLTLNDPPATTTVPEKIYD